MGTATQEDPQPLNVVTVTYKQEQASCHGQALELVELIRNEAGISHSASQALLQHLLNSLIASQKDLNVLVPSLASECNQEIFHTEEDIHESQDFNRLTQLLDELTKTKEDDQQRNWMLYEDEQSIVEYHQMETRWSIRKILIETFTLMCSIDQPVISLMLTSVLPLEVAQDMFENSHDLERLKH